jgi:hypothetical protein
MDLVVLTDETFQEEADPTQDIYRSVTLTNEEWSIVAQCVESFAETYRAKHSQTVCLWVTRGQLEEAVNEATRMNLLLQKLDQLQAKVA